MSYINTNRALSGTTLLLIALSITANSSAFAETFKQKHPRRAQVLGRDTRLNKQINGDAGKLGGHYRQLKREDRSIAGQEQRDARINGEFITKGQQNHLDKEENRVQNQINKDYR